MFRGFVFDFTHMTTPKHSYTYVSIAFINFRSLEVQQTTITTILYITTTKICYAYAIALFNHRLNRAIDDRPPPIALVATIVACFVVAAD